MDHDSQARFSATQWTLVEALKASDESVRADATETLAKRYWPPVYAHLRRVGKSKDDAAELTQGFFADVVLTRNLFERADPKSFRLRTFLLSALNNYLIDDYRRHSSNGTPGAAAEGAHLTISMDRIDEEELARSQWCTQGSPRGSGPDSDPAADFHRRWAVVVLQDALARCEESFNASGRQKHWAIFKARFVQPMMSGSKQATVKALAEELGFESYTDAIVSLRATRKKLATVFIPQVLAETNSNPKDQDGEYQLMLSLLK